MSLEKFISYDNWFSLILPENWSEYDDGDEGTYAFFDTQKWTGNFRITPIRWQSASDITENKASKLIEGELVENEGAVRKLIGSFDCAYYKKNSIQGDNRSVVYYWVAGIGSNLFICSFTIDAIQENTDQNRLELEKIEEIIQGIEIF